ncbi:MAG: hypothetical protein ABIR54_16870 [Burkholderiaceae bacterium]
MGIERLTLCVALACVAGCTTPPATPDLATYLDRRSTCDHLRGEFPDPPDPVRAREIVQLTDQYCAGSDAQLAALKVRYRDDVAVTKQLDALEPRIESPSK